VTGILAGLLVAAIGIWLITRTEWGMERARRFAVSWLADQVNGTLHIGRISGAGLLGGMVIHDFGITDPKGRPFLATDSLELSYNWRSLVAGRIDISRVVMYRPQAVLEILPGDSMWNYELVFADSTAAEGERRRMLIRFADTRIVDGSAIVRLGLHPDEPIVAADTARALVERVPGGLARTMRFEQLNAHLERVLWESPLEDGRMFEIRSAQARGYVWREPFIIQDMRGTLTMLDTVVSFDMPEVSLPDSRASVVGQVIRTAGENRFDVRVDGERLQLSDLQFLHPQLPEQGSGRVRLSIKSQPDGILWLAENAQLNTEGTRLAGSVGVVMGDTMYFTRVNLRASPLDVKLLERLLPGGLPVQGLLVGTVEVRGPISALETSGDLRLDERGTGTQSHVAWSGVIDARDGVRARSMQADVKQLDLALVSAFNPRVQLSGSVRGNVTGAGSADSMQFTGLLEHISTAGGRVVFDGGGTVSGTGRSRQLDIGVTTSSVTLQDLAKQIPALQGLHGELTGPFHIRGTPEDLTFAAQLVTPGGPLDITGGLQGDANSRHIIAHASASGFRLDALREGLPPTVASGRFFADITGKDLASATGTVRLELDSTRLYDLPNARLAVHGTLGDGLLAVDSARWRTSFGSATATGTVALMEGRTGALDVRFSSESLTPLEPWLFGEPANDGEARVAGRVNGTANVRGWLGALDVSANVSGEEIVYGGVAAARLSGDAQLRRRSGSPFEFTVGVTTDSLQLWSHPLQTARVDVSGLLDSLTFVARAANGDEERIATSGTLRMADSTLHVESLRVGGTAPWILTAPATIAVAGGTATMQAVELARAEGGRAVARGTLAWTSIDDARALPLGFTLDLDGVPFTEVLKGVRSPQTGAGVISGTLGVQGTALAPIIEGTVEVTGLRYGDVRLDRAYAELNYGGSGLDVHTEAQYDGRNILSGGGRIPLDLRFASVRQRALNEPLRFTLTAANLPPALPLSFLEGFSQTGGTLNGTINFAGTASDPALTGELRISDGAALWDVSGVRYHGVNGTIALEGDRLVRLDMIARADGARNDALRALVRTGEAGNGRVSGTVDFTNLRDPGFDLLLNANRVHAARRRDVEATVSGEITLAGSYRRPEIGGTLRVDEGTAYLEEMYRQYLIGGVQLDDPGLISLVDTTLVAVRPLLSSSVNPFLRGLLVRDLSVEVAGDSWLRSREMDVEVRGNLLVAFDMQQEALRLTGALDVTRGTYTLTYPPLQSRRFQVRDGSIEFLGTLGMDPNLSITAAYKARDSYGEPLDILAVVSGTLQNPRVRLASDAQQAISESDLASYLFFGMPTWQVSNSTSGANDRAADLGLSVLAPSVLGYASSGLQTLVQGAGLLDYVALTTSDTGAPRSGFGIGNFLTGTTLEVGRYFGSELYIGYSQMLSSASLEPLVRLQWQFLPEYSLELYAEDRLARTPGFGVRPESGLKRVYGLLLFREWGF
jgi:hypothetical protein